MWLACEQPERVERLVVCCSTARFGTEEMWLERAETVRAGGMAPLVDATIGRWFTAGFLEAHPDVATRYSAMFQSIEPEGYASCCEALASGDLRQRLAQIEASTLVLGGAHDPVVPPDNAAATMVAIPHASLRVSRGRRTSPAWKNLTRSVVPSSTTCLAGRPSAASPFGGVCSVTLTSIARSLTRLTSVLRSRTSCPNGLGERYGPDPASTGGAVASPPLRCLLLSGGARSWRCTCVTPWRTGSVLAS